MLSLHHRNIICRKRKLFPAGSACSSHSHSAAVPPKVHKAESSEKFIVYEEDALLHTVDIPQSPEASIVTKQTNSAQVDDEDLLQGLCPEDLMNCSISFCTSFENTSVGYVKHSENAVAEFMRPSHLSARTSMSLPVHSTPNISTNTAHVLSDAPGCNILRWSPVSTNFEPPKSSFSSDTFYGLPLKVKKCLEEYRGITTLYGNYDYQEV